MDYNIKSGDTLSKIASANNTTVANLASLNNISDPNKIAAGGVLKLPTANQSLTNLANTNTVAGTITPPISPVPTTEGTTSYAEIAKKALAEELALKQEQQVKEVEATDVISKFKNNLIALENKGADTFALQNEQGVQDKRLAVKNIADQILANKTQAQVQQLEKGKFGGITEGGANAISNQIERETAVKNLTLGSQLAAAEGNLALAEDYVTQAIDAKYKPLEARNTTLEKFMSINKDVLEKIDKKAYDAQQTRLQAEIKDLEEKKQNDMAIQNMLVQASSQNAPQSLTQKASNAKTPAEAAMILGQYAGDYYKTELLKNQIQTEKAQRAKINASIANDTRELNAKLSATAAPVTPAKLTAAQDTISLVNDLLTGTGKSAAVGAGFKKSIVSLIPGVGPDAIPGTARAGYETKVAQLRDTLASANLDKLKGAMSDKDIEFLRNTATALSLNMNEKDFDKELNKIKSTMQKVIGVEPNDTLEFENVLSNVNSNMTSTSSFINQFNLNNK